MHRYVLVAIGSSQTRCVDAISCNFILVVAFNSANPVVSNESEVTVYALPSGLVVL